MSELAQGGVTALNEGIAIPGSATVALEDVYRAQRRIWQWVWTTIGAGALLGATAASAVVVFGDPSPIGGDAAAMGGISAAEADPELVNSVTAAVLGAFGIALAMHVRSSTLVMEFRKGQDRPEVQADILGRLRFFDSAVALIAISCVALGVFVTSLALITGHRRAQAALALALALLLTTMLGDAGGVPLTRLGDFSADLRAQRAQRLSRSREMWSEPPPHASVGALRLRMALQVVVIAVAACAVVLVYATLREAMGLAPVAGFVLSFTCAVAVILAPMTWWYLSWVAAGLRDQQLLLGSIAALSVVLGHVLYISLARSWPGPSALDVTALTVSAAVILLRHLVQLFRPRAAVWRWLHLAPALELTVRRRTQRDLDELEAGNQRLVPRGLFGPWYWRLGGRSP